MLKVIEINKKTKRNDFCHLYGTHDFIFCELKICPLLSTVSDLMTQGSKINCLSCQVTLAGPCKKFDHGQGNNNTTI